jgi:hypothetical protein
MKRVHGKKNAEEKIEGFMLGCALAKASFEHENYGLPNVIKLQHKWVAYSGFTHVLTLDLLEEKENSKAFKFTKELIVLLIKHPEIMAINTKEKKQSLNLYEECQDIYNIVDIWSSNSGWINYPSLVFCKDIISHMFVASPNLLLPILDNIRTPTIINEIFSSPNIMFDPELLQLILEHAPLITDLNENMFIQDGSSPKPTWNRSIIAVSIIPFIFEYAQYLEEWNSSNRNDTLTVNKFLTDCANLLIARPDGVFVAQHFVDKLHYNIDNNLHPKCSEIFLDKIVDAVPVKKKNTLLTNWIDSDFKNELNKLPESDYELFIQTGCQTEKRIGIELKTLIAQARLLPLPDLQGECGERLIETYEHLFCYNDDTFFTSGYSSRLPTSLHEALAWIFLSSDESYPMEKWEKTYLKLGGAENRFFRNSYDNNSKNLYYLVNFHWALGLALADVTCEAYGTDRAEKVLHTLFERLLGKFKFNDTLMIDSFYSQIISLLICRSYTNSLDASLESINYLDICQQKLPVNDCTNKAQNCDKNNQVILRLGSYLSRIQNIPMLAFEVLEDLQLNYLTLDDFQDYPDLITLVRDAYISAKIIDQNDYMKSIAHEDIGSLCDKKIEKLNSFL